MLNSVRNRNVAGRPSCHLFSSTHIPLFILFGFLRSSLQSTSLGPAVFSLHLLIEIPASINFFIHPSGQLDSPAPQAHTVIRQYAILLFVSNVIAAIFAFRNIDRTSKNVAGALALYHIGPVFRAGTFMMSRDKHKTRAFGGAYLHFGVHLVCLAFLLLLFTMSNDCHEIKAEKNEDGELMSHLNGKDNHVPINDGRNAG